MKAEEIYAQWITHGKATGSRFDSLWVECSNCGTVGSPQWKRCPVCEAKIREDNDGLQ